MRMELGERDGGAGLKNRYVPHRHKSIKKKMNGARVEDWQVET